jgi:hypothetical protein
MSENSQRRFFPSATLIASITLEFGMNFRITGLDSARFAPLFTLDAEELATRQIARVVVDCNPGFPDRISLEDCEIGETVLLMNFQHQPANNPYQASHAIFIREAVAGAFDAVNRVPAALGRRILSLRAFDQHDAMVAAELADGAQAEVMIRLLFEQPSVAYIHAHFAKRGCYAARIERV